MEEEILVYDVIFCKFDENGNTILFQAKDKDFSHVSEYVEEKDLTPIVDWEKLYRRGVEKSEGDENTIDKLSSVLQEIHTEWAENWDLLINFLGQEMADKIDKAVGYDKDG